MIDVFVERVAVAIDNLSSIAGGLEEVKQRVAREAKMENYKADQPGLFDVIFEKATMVARISDL